MPRKARRGSADGRLRALLLGVLLLGVPAPARVAAEGWAAGPPRRGPIPLERTPNGTWIVEARLNGRFEGRFLLDTGASWCGLTSQAAAHLRLPQVGESIRMQTAGGIVPMPTVRIASVEVAGRRARDVQAVILPDELDDLDGILGMNFLNNFVYAIDPRRSVLHLR
jgi:clan AA aspartic protease (TIGR02281 family)